MQEVKSNLKQTIKNLSLFKMEAESVHKTFEEK
jgi:hypothetical protein